ncbi:hypothetical protein QJQ45_009250 [Haematococcus lacustris]|nr:hypothetical protein QJQ45_009250 [Haematococcus lacustris]
MNSNTTGLNPPTPGNTTSPHGTSKSIKLNFSKTPGGSKKLDRFIPLRPALDVDLANLQLTKENTGNGADGSEGASLSPSRDEFQRALAGQLGIDQSGRILAFRQKAPAPPEGHDNNLRGLYTDNLGPAPAKKNFRHIPQTQERILDAPDLVDDYYLNLLDWSCNNSIAIALGSTVYLWNAATGSVEELCTLPNEGDYVGSVAWSADGAYLAVGTSDAKVQIWDASRCKQIRELAGHTNRVSAVAWAGTILSSGGRDSVINCWDVRKRRDEACVARLISHEQEAAVKAIAWCPFQSNLLATGGGTADRCIKFWNTHTGVNLSSIDTGSQVGELTGHQGRVLHMATSPDGSSVVSAGADETLRFWRVFGEPVVAKDESKAAGAAGTGSGVQAQGLNQLRGRVVLVDEHRTTRVSSAVNGNVRRSWKPPAGQVELRLLRAAWSQQCDLPVRGLMWCPVVAPRKPPQARSSSQGATPAAASVPGPSTPPPAKRTKAEHAVEAQGKAAKAKPVPQLSRWLDRDCNAALNMQRIGGSKWRTLELCYWADQGALPAKGKEYPSLGYKRLRDKPPKAQQQPAETHDSEGPIAVSDVTLTPDPPVIGCVKTFQLIAGHQCNIPAGAVEIQVSFSGIQIYSESQDLCSKTACPVPPGPVTINIVEDLPPIAPPGDYGLRVIGTDAAGNELMCLDVDFELVLPSESTSLRHLVPGSTGKTQEHIMLATGMAAEHIKQDQPPAQAPPGPVPRLQAPPWGRWLDRDTNPCLNLQRTGESKQRPLELCSYEGPKALPPIGKSTSSATSCGVLTQPGLYDARESQAGTQSQTKPTADSQARGPQLDFILAVPDPSAWHAEVTGIAQHIGVGIHFNTLVNINGQVMQHAMLHRH